MRSAACMERDSVAPLPLKFCAAKKQKCFECAEKAYRNAYYVGYTPIQPKTGSCMKARPKGYRSSTWRLQVSRRIQVTNVVRLHFVVIVQIIAQI